MTTDKKDRRDESEDQASMQLEAGQSLFILKDGQKAGPYTKDEVINMIQNREVLVTDSATSNGHEWFQLHSWTDFDRRLAHEEDLPGMPQVNLFIQSDEEVDKNLSHKNDEQIEKECMAGLAYIGNINSGKRAQYHNDKYLKAEESKEDIDIPELDPVVFEKKSISKETYLWGSVLSIAIVGILYLFFSPSEPNRAPATKDKQVKTVTNKVQSPKSKAVKRAIIKKPKKVQAKRAPRKTRSFTSSKAFKNRAPRRAPAKAKRVERPVVEDPDDYYYDDGTDPVELDPVRSKIAKETLDPRNEELDESFDEFDAEREPAAEEFTEEELEEDPEKAFEALYE